MCVVLPKKWRGKRRKKRDMKNATEQRHQAVFEDNTHKTQQSGHLIAGVTAAKLRRWSQQQRTKKRKDKLHRRRRENHM